MDYTHLTQDERYQIFFFRQRGLSDRGIGRELGRSHSTISRELKQNQGLRRYRPKAAKKIADRRWMSVNRRVPTPCVFLSISDRVLIREKGGQHGTGNFKKETEHFQDG